MDENIFVFEADIYTYGTNDILKTVQLLAYNLFQANHILVDWISENDMFRDPIEVGVIRRLRGINYIINPEFWAEMLAHEDNSNNEYDGSIPLRIAKHLDEDDTITFECYCKTEIKIPADMGFPFVTCPNPKCENHIKRSEIKMFGTHWIYEKDENDK